MNPPGDFSNTEPDVAAVILAMERAALDRSDQGDASGFLEISDPDVVYIDPFLPSPLYGLEALRVYYKQNLYGEVVTGRILNPKVQVAGGVAALTFNYTVVYRGSGKTTHWNATEVYRRGADGWRIMHTHWSFVRPQVGETA